MGRPARHARRQARGIALMDALWIILIVIGWLILSRFVGG
jgi:hypothetical protein